MKNLHVIAFSVPYPPDFGGVMDVYYKIKTLSDLGAKIHLHCFEHDRPRSEILDKICEKVFYYERKVFFRYFFNRKPFIVNTRKDDDLLTNLSQDNYPILFEGLHTCFLLKEPSLKDREKIVRMHNVESDYYKALSKQESNVFRKMYLYSESYKLKKFEQILNHAQAILAISEKDQTDLESKYENVHYVPAFHSNENLSSRIGMGGYALYHGNLDVIENVRAALFLIKKVFNDLDVPLVIAGNDSRGIIKEAIKNRKGIKLVQQPETKELNRLLIKAQMNVLPTFQATGVKLKLLNALYKGRHCIVNPEMVEGTQLDQVCIVSKDAAEMKENVVKYASISFSEKIRNERRIVLERRFSNVKNGLMLGNIIGLKGLKKKKREPRKLKGKISNDDLIDQVTSESIIG